MHVTIDRDECIQCGSCSAICPAFFEPDEDARSQIVAEYRAEGNPGAGEAPESLHDCVTEAADACPVSIIHAEAPEGAHSHGPWVPTCAAASAAPNRYAWRKGVS